MNRLCCITPGTTTLYRVYLLGREVCATDLLDKAIWAVGEARLALIQTITLTAGREPVAIKEAA